MSGDASLLFEGLAGVIRQTAFETHRYFGNGFFEKVYENALANRLRKRGLNVRQQAGLVVHDEDGTVVGEYVADLIVNDCVVVEIKGVASFVGEHVAQVLNYLKATGLQVGLLVNFGASRLQVKRLVFESARSASSASSAAR